MSKAGDEGLLGQKLKVINIGLELFAETLKRHGAPHVQLDWRPPAQAVGSQWPQGTNGPSLRRAAIDEANRVALQRIIDAEPVLVDVTSAGDAIPELADLVLLHAGPPIDWRDMCEPMRAAIVGAIRFEGWATTGEEAEALAGSGGVKLLPNHDLGAVGPMTGITTRSMPGFVVENRTFGNRAFCTINEGLGRVLRFGANDEQVIERLHWMRNTLAPALGAAVRHAGAIELKPIMARALTMGDEMHQRNVAASSLLLRELSPHLARTSAEETALVDVLKFLGGNDQFFLNLAMAAGKATMDPLAGIEGATVVSAMSRNGRDFGIRVSGSGDRWFIAPAMMPEGLYFPGFTAADANLDLGDSAILETMGLGAFAMGAAPAVVGFVGAGTFRDALNYTREMAEITVGQNPHFGLPTLDYLGTPCGIDVRKVVDSGVTPAINTGIAHRRAGVGQVGAGIVRAPMECFTQAFRTLADQL